MIQKPPKEPTAAAGDENERALVAALMVKQSAFDLLGDTVTGADFNSDLYGRMFDVLHEMHNAGKPLNDAKIVFAVFESANLPLCGERLIVVIAKLIGEGIPSHVRFYADEILKCAQLRKLAAIKDEFVDRISDRTANPAEVAQWLDAKLSGVAQRQQTPARQADEIAVELLAEIDEHLKSGKPRGTPSGLEAHDLAFGSFMPKEVTVLAARPGIGKSSLGMQIAEYNARQGRRVLVVSLEMDDKQLIQRTLCKLAGVNNRDIRAGNINLTDRRNLAAAAELIRGHQLQVWSPSSAGISQIRAIAKLHAASGPLSLVVIDYIGKIRVEDSKLRRHEQIAQFMSGVTQIAKELSVPVLCLAQLNRESTDGAPQLQHLAESGALERDADCVMFLHRDPTTPHETELIVAKHRFGEVGKLILGWDPVRTTFTDGPLSTAPPPERHDEFDSWNEPGA